MPQDHKPFARNVRDAIAHLSSLLQIVHLVWTAAPGKALSWIILLVVEGLLPAAIVYLTRMFIDRLLSAMAAGNAPANIQPILGLGIAIAAIMVLMQLLQAAIGYVRTALSEVIEDAISARVHDQSMRVDLAFYESPEYYDRLHRARSDASSRCLALLEHSGSLLQTSITLLAMAALLTAFGIWLPLLLFVSVMPVFYVVLRVNQREYRWWQRTTPDRRWIQYYDIMLTHGGAAAELRLFDLGTYFQAAYQALRRRLRSERLQLTADQSLAHISAGITGLLIAGAVTAWMIWRALQGLVTLGELVLFHQAFTQGQNLLHVLLRSIGQIYTNGLFLSNLCEFLRLESHIADPLQPIPAPAALKEGIHFRHVTFRYPGSERAVLRDFTLTIPAGQIVAIVGANGAGKSTLVKLLCRFYDPEEGCIELDGVDIRSWSVVTLRRMVTVLFQLPITYHATAAQNIALGDLSAMPNRRDIEVAAQAAGAHEVIARLPQGYDTLLGKQFANGVELSGGEWQRLALARAFFRRAPIILLDEPTSLMDSWAEADWLLRFRALATGRTAIIITHRFTTAMCADTIHVMRDGQIIESGGHDELLAYGGLYAQSWTTQMQAGARTKDLGQILCYDGNGEYPT